MVYLQRNLFNNERGVDNFYGGFCYLISCAFGLDGVDVFSFFHVFVAGVGDVGKLGVAEFEFFESESVDDDFFGIIGDGSSDGDYG